MLTRQVICTRRGPPRWRPPTPHFAFCYLIRFPNATSFEVKNSDVVCSEHRHLALHTQHRSDHRTLSVIQRPFSMSLHVYLEKREIGTKIWGTCDHGQDQCRMIPNTEFWGYKCCGTIWNPTDSLSIRDARVLILKYEAKKTQVSDNDDEKWWDENAKKMSSSILEPCEGIFSANNQSPFWP
jgi:hypothetical protein